MDFNTDFYLSLVEAQHKTRPKFMAVLRKYLEDGMAAQDAALEIPQSFSLEDAEGAQLDIIGKVIGVSRDYPYAAGGGIATMTDDQYRMVIRATIARNHWDGSFHSFADTWNEIFAGQAITATVVDNMDMSCTVSISGDFDSAIAALITSGYVFPKPMGVQMTYAVSPQGDRTGEADLNIGAAYGSDTSIITITAQ